MTVTVPLKRMLNLRRPTLVIDGRAVELRAPSSLRAPWVLPRDEVVGVWVFGDDWDTHLETVAFWLFHGLKVELPDVGLVLRRPVEPPPMRALYRRDLIHPTVDVVLFPVEDRQAALDAFRRAGLRLLDAPVDRF